MKKFDINDDVPTDENLGMTHYVNLPSQGIFYPEGHPLHGQDSVEVKMLTTREEDILTNPSYIETGTVIEKLLQSILIKKIPAQQLFEGDIMAIIIAARIEAYGQQYEVVKQCSNCTKEYNIDLNLENFVNNFVTSDYETTENNTVIAELPRSKKVVEFRHLLPTEISSIEKTVEKMKKMNVNTTFNEELYKRSILSVDGVTDPGEISKFVTNMRIMDSRKFFIVYNETSPSLDLSFKSTCSHCETEQEGGLPIQASFFYPRI